MTRINLDLFAAVSRTLSGSASRAAGVAKGVFGGMMGQKLSVSPDAGRQNNGNRNESDFQALDAEKNAAANEKNGAPNCEPEIKRPRQRMSGDGMNAAALELAILQCALARKWEPESAELSGSQDSTMIVAPPDADALQLVLTLTPEPSEGTSGQNDHEAGTPHAGAWAMHGLDSKNAMQAEALDAAPIKTADPIARNNDDAALNQNDNTASQLKTEHAGSASEMQIPLQQAAEMPSSASANMAAARNEHAASANPEQVEAHGRLLEAEQRSEQTSAGLQFDVEQPEKNLIAAEQTPATMQAVSQAPQHATSGSEKAEGVALAEPVVTGAESELQGMSTAATNARQMLANDPAMLDHAVPKKNDLTSLDEGAHTIQEHASGDVMAAHSRNNSALSAEHGAFLNVTTGANQSTGSLSGFSGQVESDASYRGDEVKQNAVLSNQAQGNGVADTAGQSAGSAIFNEGGVVAQRSEPGQAGHAAQDSVFGRPFLTASESHASSLATPKTQDASLDAPLDFARMTSTGDNVAASRNLNADDIADAHAGNPDADDVVDAHAGNPDADDVVDEQAALLNQSEASRTDFSGVKKTNTATGKAGSRVSRLNAAKQARPEPGLDAQAVDMKARQVPVQDAGLGKPMNESESDPSRDVFERRLAGQANKHRVSEMDGVDALRLDSVRSAPAAAAAPVRNAFAAHTAERVERLQELVARLDEHALDLIRGKTNSMTIQLAPPNLGRVSMNCREDEGVIRLEIAVENDAVRNMLQQQERNLREMLEQGGYKLAQFDVKSDGHGLRHGEQRKQNQAPRRHRLDVPTDVEQEPVQGVAPSLLGRESVWYIA